MSNRKQRRRQERAQERERIKAARERTTDLEVELRAPESEHATVMIMGQPEWTPFQREPALDLDGAQRWSNSRYIVALYPPERNPTPDGWPGVVHLSFKHHANVAITDFRDMQQIKNELVGPEAMALQIFPAESQLVDGANQYHLWILVPDTWPEVPDGAEWPWLPVGFREGRHVDDVAPTGGRQRSFAQHVDLLDQDRAKAEETRPRIAERIAEMKRNHQGGEE